MATLKPAMTAPRNAVRDTGLMLRNWLAALCADKDVNHAGKDATDGLEIVFNA